MKNTTAQQNRYQRNIDRAFQREDDARSMGRAIRQTPAQHAESEKRFALLAKTWHPTSGPDGKAQWCNGLDGCIVSIDPRVADPTAVVRDRAEMQSEFAHNKGTK
jgi:hypothetical protein